MMSSNKSSHEQFVHFNNTCADNVIVEGHFVEEKQTSTDQPARKSSRGLLVVMLIAVAVFVYDRYYLTSQDSVVDKAPVVEEKAIVSINSVLINKQLFSSNVKPVATTDTVPQAIAELIHGQDVAKLQKATKEEKIVIYEIIEEVDNSRKIQSLLREAAALFRADKLTLPKGNNAFERYEWVLALDVDNQQAKQGIKKIVDRYVNLSEKVIKKDEAFKVAGLINNAYRVGNKYMDMQPIVDKYLPYIEDKSAFIQMPLNSTINADSEAAKEELGALALARNSEEETQASSALQDVDKSIALTANKLLLDGDSDGAVKVLQRFTQISDYWASSYDLLFELYLSQNNIVSAKQLVTRNGTLNTFQMAEKAARMFYASDDAKGGLVMLNGYTPDIRQNQEFYAVKASLYYETGQFSEAAQVYRQLIAQDYGNSRYWLGLAVSFDAMGDESAETAFRYAAQYSDSNAKVKEYINQKLLVSNP